MNNSFLIITAVNKKCSTVGSSMGFAVRQFAKKCETKCGSKVTPVWQQYFNTIRVSFQSSTTKKLRTELF